MTSTGKFEIDTIKMKEEGADFQTIYDCKNANFYLFSEDHIVPYILELLSVPVCNKRGANAMLMWLFEQWDDIVGAVGRAWPIVEDKPHAHALLFTFKILSVMVNYGLKPWWYAPFLGRETSVLAFPWMTGILASGVEYTDCLKVMSSDVSYEQWQEIFCPVVQLQECEIEPETIEPMPIVLANMCNIVAEENCDDEAAVSFAVGELIKNVATDNLDVACIVSKIIATFYDTCFRTVFKLICNDSPYKEHPINGLLYELLERLAKVDAMNVCVQFYPYHLRFMAFIIRHIDSLLGSGEMGIKILERLFTFLIVHSPNVSVRKYNVDEALFLIQVFPPLTLYFNDCREEFIEDIAKHSVLMKSVLPDRWREVYILSRPFIEDLAKNYSFRERDFQQISRLSLVAHVYLAPPGDYSFTYRWGESDYGTIQQVIPWLRVANVHVRPTRYIFSMEDVNLYLYRKNRTSPTNVSLMRPSGSVSPVALPSIVDGVGDITMGDPNGKFCSNVEI